MKKQHLLIILFYFISIDTFSQDYIMIERIGPSDKYLPALMINKRETPQLYNFDSICHSFTQLMTCHNIELNSNKYQVFKNLMIKAKTATGANARSGYTEFRIIINNGKVKRHFNTSSEKSIAFFVCC